MAEFIPNPLAAEIVKHEIGTQMALTDAAEQGAAFARDRVRVDTGALRDSIAVEDSSEGDGKRVVIGTDYWMFNEFGTSDVEANPVMRAIPDALGLNQ